MLESGAFTLRIVSAVTGTERRGVSAEDSSAWPVCKIGKNAELILIKKSKN